MRYLYRIVGTLIGIGIAILMTRTFDVSAQWQLPLWMLLIFVTTYTADYLYKNRRLN